MRTLVELHGGSVQAASRGQGQGATFTVRLPVLEGQPDPGAGQRPRGAAAERADLHGLHVLIVEDDLDTGSLLAEVVASSGAETRMAGSAAEALDVLGRWRVDLLLSDKPLDPEELLATVAEVAGRGVPPASCA